MLTVLSMTYYWLKAGHIIFVIFWMAGLFMLPRYFVYHQEAPEGSPENAVWTEREGKLLKIILWPEPEPLFHIIKEGSYFAPNYSGYRDNPVDAGKYTKAELKPYADQIARGSLKAVPVTTV